MRQRSRAKRCEIVAIEPLYEPGGEVGQVLRARGALELAGTGSAFDGKYLVARVGHRFGAGEPGYHTLLSLNGPDAGQFTLPEVGDEVLVAFAGGDPERSPTRRADLATARRAAPE